MGKIRLYWADLVELEPRLRDLLNEIRDIKDDGDPATYFCANAIMFKPYNGRPSYKRRLRDIVGWDRPEHQLAEQGLLPSKPEVIEEEDIPPDYQIWELGELYAPYEEELERAQAVSLVPIREQILHMQEAYELSYDTLYGALPGCRNCQCFYPPD